MSAESYLVPAADLSGLLPELLLTGGGVLALLLDAFFPRLTRLTLPVCLAAVLAAGHHLFWGGAHGESFHGLLESTPLTIAISWVVLLSTLLALLASEGFLRREGLSAGEYYSLLLWCAAGVLLMTRAQELVTLFVALELLSICLYSLAAYHRRLPLSTEAGIKYFLMGAFVSSFVLLGIALLYGEAGSTRFGVLAAHFSGTDSPSSLAVLGLLLLVAGFGFKMSVVPFHAWAPDTYQGAPSPFVGFLSVAPKAASAVVLVRLLELALAHGDGDGKWSQVIALLAVASMALGNFFALVQRDIKRMLAYSGIAHMGYLLVALVTLDTGSFEALIVYLLAYALMNAGAFAVIALLYSEPGEQHLISDLGGLGQRYPLLSACLAICLLSLGGIPPTLGFLGKYLVFVQALDTGNLWLALVVVGTSLIGVFYYLRVIYTLYMRPEVGGERRGLTDGWGRLAAVLAAAGTLVLGLWPGKLLSWVYEIASKS